MIDLRQAGKAMVDRWVIEKVGDKLLLNGKEIDPGTIELRLDGLTYRSSEKMEVRQQAEPVKKPPYPGWKPGCQVCGAHGAVGFVCPRSDCPTKVTCGGVV